MKYLKQVMIIGVISFIGEMLSIVLPLPVPGSVYGMLLLLLCLCFKIVRLEQVEETADFLLLIMPLTLVPPGISIMNTYLVVKDSIVSLVLIAFVTAILTMLATGFVTQILVRIQAKRKEAKQHE